MALFVTLEGGEGAGKSSVAGELASRMRAAEIDVVATREPGGTALGAKLRQELFHVREEGGEPIAPWTETLLLMADRAHHVETIIRPALARGAVVISDRFADSSIAYQGYGRQLDLQRVRELNQIATGGLTPNLTLLLDIPVREGTARARPEADDRIGMETVEFHSRVLEGYKRLAMSEPERIKTIDAAQPLAAVIAEAWGVLAPRLTSQGYRVEV